MKTICLLAQKGGTGKTTLCLHLAVLASDRGREVVVVDIDPPGQLELMETAAGTRNA